MSKEPKCRFIEEYANFRKECTKRNFSLSADQKRMFCEKIDKIVRITRKGYITVDECMRLLSDWRALESKEF